MTNPRQLVNLIYDVFADNNVSRILPVLDEKIVLYISEVGRTGSTYHGRSGFLSMIAGLYKICENLSVHSLVYFTPDDDQVQDTIMTTGFLEGKLLIDNEPASLPFVHHWQVKAEKVVALRSFNWDSAELFHRLGPNRSSNGQHKAGNGSQ